ncbi:Reverse transcriptase (RNA-dependent DNA polymerase) [Fragilaria crotonensis]|nr:Reverse transcriptase (RNA-dependent DNA polymerase) [Fragilaria crotonensis]
MPRYQSHFQKANKERPQVDCVDSGYHGAHAAITTPPGPAPPLAAAAAAALPSLTTPPPGPTTTTIADGQPFFYCWTHGLGTNRTHTSATCNRPGPGHQTTATTRHMMGGNNTILRGVIPVASPPEPTALAPVGPPTIALPPSVPAIADTGSTAHFCTIDAPVINRRPTSCPISIHTPGGTILTSTHEAELDLPFLPLAARHVHIVPSLATASLLSIGQLCDAGCVAEFTATTLTVTFQHTIVLTGTRTLATRLWHVQLPAASPSRVDHSAFSAIGSATPAQLVAFAHAALFSPALSTLDQALAKGYLTNFPGLTRELLRKHPPHSPAMIKGHLDQSRQHQRSTKLTQGSSGAPILELEHDNEAFPAPDDALPPGARSHFCYAAVMEPTGQVYSDQTGRFITPSSTGNNYLIIVYDYDSNCILAEPIRDRSAHAILQGYKTLHTQLCNAGLRPALQRLDNECSAPLKSFLHDEGIDFQLAPPGVHRRNAAERAIRTFKNHFIGGLCSVDKHFPLHLWDRLLPQALVTLNLLRSSRINPKLSAWSQLHGQFDFNRTPIAPPGIRVLVHDKPATRGTWAPHALDGWYVGPALDSYRCYSVWMFDSRATRISDTLVWFPTQIPMPIASSTDLVLAGIADIHHALSNPSPGSALAPTTASQVASLKLLTNLLSNICAPTATPPLPSPLPAPSPAAHPTSPLLVHVDDATEPAPVPLTPPPLPPTAVLAAPLRVELPPSPPLSSAPITYATATRRSRRRRKPPAHLAATAVTAHSAHPAHYALHGNAFNPDTGQLAEYPELSRSSEGPEWIASMTDEFGRLCQGHATMPTGTNTMYFIAVRDIPKHKKPTYIRVVAALRPEKSNPRRVRITVGGDRIEYDGNVSTKTADLTTVKTMLNSVISTVNGRFMTGDLKDFYLGTPMTEYEYMRIPISMIPPAIMEHYQLTPLIHNGHVYVEIRKGMYGLPQAGILANDRLADFLKPHGYSPAPLTPGLWRHASRPIAFTLVVDDFGVKYTRREDAEHLMNSLRLQYAVSEDWTGARYCGLTLNWDYTRGTVDISIPGYVARALKRFNTQHPLLPNIPHAYIKPTFGAKQQLTPLPDASPALDLADTKRVQEVLGTFLYYARAVDSTVLTAIGTLATQQAHGTKSTMHALTQFLNYAASNPEATVRYVRSDMVLHVESDASYLSAPKSRSRAAGYHYLSSRPPDPTKPPPANATPPPGNGAINVLCQILKEVVSSAAEAELAALFHNGKEACPLRTCLEELGHPQPPTPIVTDNNTAAGIANDTMKQRRSKAIDMRFYWVRDRVRQGQFIVYWRRGALNKADYFTKHHPASHHQEIRSSYLHAVTNPSRNYFECLQDTLVTPRAPSPNSVAGEGVLIPSSLETNVHNRVRASVIMPDANDLHQGHSMAPLPSPATTLP